MSYRLLNACLLSLFYSAAALHLSLAAPPSSSPRTPNELPRTAPVSPKVTSHGTYRDGSGAQHNWQITEAHALWWDGAPYVPVGTAFAPRSLHKDSQSDWQADVQALTALKARGLRDLLLQFDRPLFEAPAD